MLNFKCDYLVGAHPKILEKFMETNMEVCTPYGNDVYSESAKKKIIETCGNPNAEVHLLTGGTQTNKIVISAMLQSHEGVIAAVSGHIAQHEAGAIEASGHKVLQIPGKDGKLCAEDVKKFIENFYADPSYEHMVFPGMVYVSHPTEYGTLYSRAELKALSEVCKKFNIPLFMDGARLGYGLMSKQTDVTIEDISRLCDVFYFGGTKVGALCGEAVVFTHKNTPKHFFTFIKQNGALLAKGRLLGVQFDTLFTDGLYFEISKNAIETAEKLKKIFKDKGYELFINSPTNQQFIILSNAKMEELKEKVVFEFWERLDEDRAVVRFCTSWATTEKDIEELNKII